MTARAASARVFGMIQRVERYTIEGEPGVFFASEAEAQAYLNLLIAEEEANLCRARYEEISLDALFREAKAGFTGRDGPSVRRICAGIAAYMTNPRGSQGA